MTSASVARRYAEASRLLMALPRFTDQGAAAYRPGLERIRALREAIGGPAQEYPIVHVAGTNGKGSVASFTASMLSASGLVTGLHTSPHLLEIGERMRINGVPADKKWLGSRVLRCRRVMEDVKPSFFEMTVALSLLYFAERNVDVAVVEVGLGGRLDATNAVNPSLSVITGIGMDHTEILGATVELVAREKAGIIKDAVPVVTGAEGAAFEVIRRIAEERSAPLDNVRGACSISVSDLGLESSTFSLSTPKRHYNDLTIDVPMAHQIWNAAIAVLSFERMADVLNVDAEDAAVRAGLQNVRARSGLRGRFEILSRNPLVVADVAHNADGIVAIVNHVKDHAAGTLYVCIAMMKDKSVDGIGALLARVNAKVMAVSVESQRAFSGARLASLLKQPQLQVDNRDTVRKAIGYFRSIANPDDVLLVTGSHLAVAEAIVVSDVSHSGETPLDTPRR